MDKKMGYQNGLTISQTTTFTKFLFGENNHIKNKKNYELWRFEIFIKKEVFTNETSGHKMRKMRDYFEEKFKNVKIIEI